MTDNPAYPMWAILCNDCGFVGSMWEAVGTAVPYVEYCPACGTQQVSTARVESKSEHESIIEEANEFVAQ